MKTDFIITIDQSTSGTKVLLINNLGEIIDMKSVSHKQIYNQPGWVEHDPVEIYENVKKLLQTIIKTNFLTSDVIKAVSITNQRETVLVWDKATGMPVYNAIVWQCRRTTEICNELKNQGFESSIKSKTGLTLDPYFSASKVKWILENVDGVKEQTEQKRLLLGTIDSWLVWKLTNGNVHATDFTNASRTLLFNIRTLQWDQELLDIFDVPEIMLPNVRSSNDGFGEIEDEALPFFKTIPISGVIGDSQGALFGQKCFDEGMAKATYGTGTSVLMQTGSLVDSKNGLVSSIAWGINGKISYALEGIIHSTGDVINWVKELGLFSEFYETERLAGSLSDNQGVYLVPAFVGLGAPYWDPSARAALVGMSRNTGKAHIIRAALECIAYQVKDVIELMQTESSIKIKELRVDGGATKNNFLMQFQADLLDTRVKASKVSELSAMGSFYLAGLAVGFWNSQEEIMKLNKENLFFEPTLTSEKKNKFYKGWRQAVGSILVK